MQNVHGRGNPFYESVITIVGSAECGDLLPEDGEDCLGGTTGLKFGKDRMRGEIMLGFTFVSRQSSVECDYGRKVGIRGGCGGAEHGRNEEAEDKRYEETDSGLTRVNDNG
jgi:hypothetical protein